MGGIREHIADGFIKLINCDSSEVRSKGGSLRGRVGRGCPRERYSEVCCFVVLPTYVT